VNEIERRASEARRLTDEPLLKEALALSERRDLEELLNLKDWRIWRLHRRRQVIIDRINVRREMLRHLQTVITLGKQEEQRHRMRVA
jgi:hypothetical protein